jgi:antitoxin component YwqK of YwqJK toxin-antitoxin module
MKINYFITSLFIISLFACVPKEHTVIESRYPDGSPKKVCVYRGDIAKKDLVKETAYYSDRKVQVTGEYKNNKRDGRWIFYYSNGKIWSEGYFREGLNDGKRLTFYENGKLRYEAWYDKGERIGRWKLYDENGNLKQVLDYTGPSPKK